MALSAEAIQSVFEKWGERDPYYHLAATFDLACQSHPDLMERYMAQLESDDKPHNTKVMRRGLAETFNQRFPIPEQYK